VCFYGHLVNFLSLFSVLLCSEVRHGCSCVPQAWDRFLHDASSEINIKYIKMWLNFVILTHFTYSTYYALSASYHMYQRKCLS
jgi:hypothetical protein